MNKLHCERHECYFCGIKEDPNIKSCRSLIETHHIKEQHEGGKNNPSNLIRCCSTCHSKIHLKIIQLFEWYNFGYKRELEWSEENKTYVGAYNRREQ